jgi:hypothetical protein
MLMLVQLCRDRGVALRAHLFDSQFFDLFGV